MFSGGLHYVSFNVHLPRSRPDMRFAQCHTFCYLGDLSTIALSLNIIHFTADTLLYLVLLNIVGTLFFFDYEVKFFSYIKYPKIRGKCNVAIPIFSTLALCVIIQDNQE